MTSEKDIVNPALNKEITPKIVERVRLFQEIDHLVLEKLFGFEPMNVPVNVLNEWVKDRWAVNPVTKCPMFVANLRAMEGAKKKVEELGYVIEDKASKDSADTCLSLLETAGHDVSEIRTKLKKTQ